MELKIVEWVAQNLHHPVLDRIMVWIILPLRFSNRNPQFKQPACGIGAASPKQRSREQVGGIVHRQVKPRGRRR